MSNHKNLVFFNKEGDYLNFNYNESTERFEGDVLFFENSSDTFKTSGLYMLERIPSFEFESPGDLGLRKFQIFNEWGLNFYGCAFSTQSVTSIEPINNDPNYYSKWINGVDFDKEFPIGTIIRFNSQFTEFTNLNQTYTVVYSKKNAIMIISSMDNATFESTFYNDYSLDTNYSNLTISGVNAVGIYDYIDQNYENNLSSWNEPNFYDDIYVRRKLNIINSELNNGIVTIKNENLTDLSHFEYFANKTDLPTGQDLIIEVSTKTDLPKLYEGPVEITADNKLKFGLIVPDILFPGEEIKIIGSSLNQNFLTISSVPSFNANTQLTFYATQSHVLYNNKVYECIQSYTQSFDIGSGTEFVNPTDVNYWTPYITYLSVDQSTTYENLSTCQIYLTSDKLYFSYGWTYSSEVTMASAAEKYKNELKVFNVDLYYNDSKIKADLIYPSQYAEVKFYATQISTTYSITQVRQTKERLIETKEKLNYELNYDISSNHSMNIVFTDLDEYGLKLRIEKQIFEEEISWVYSGGSPDMQRTIDKTLRAWLTRNFLKLYAIGINAELKYIGSYYSPFFNTIKLTTQYPNVPFNIQDILVGTTADFYVEHSRILFTDLGSNLTITINGEDYEQVTSYSGNLPDISTTLTNWVSEHGSYLSNFGFIVSNVNNTLYFNIKRLDLSLVYSINVGKSSLPGKEDYKITKRLLGNQGCLITSNEVTLSATSSYSFETEGFATGMVFSINNSFFNYNCQEYNVEFLDPGVMNLSYQGPFWSTVDNICNSSAFMTIAFEVGFGQTACPPTPGPTGSQQGGPFNIDEFSTAFSLSYNFNSYSTSYLSGVTNMVDLLFVQYTNNIYVYGDNLSVIDADTGTLMSVVTLTGNTQSIELKLNPVNNYLYCVAKNMITVVDPALYTVLTTITLTYDVSDVEINLNNGDLYISYENSGTVDIYNSSNSYVTTLNGSTTNFPPFVTSTGKMVFNSFEGDMYVITNANNVLRVNTDRTIQTSYGVPGATNSIFYEPVNESVYVFGTNNLYKIDNGVTYSITSISTGSFNDIIYNNLTGEMNLSDSSTLFRALNLNSNSVTVTSSIGNYGYITQNQFDGDVYLSSQSLNAILVIRPTDGMVIHTEALTSGSTKIIYNPERKSVWAIQPTTNQIIELKVTLNSSINIQPSTYSVVGENLYGTLDPNYEPHPDLWIKTKEYLRRPRENFQNETKVKYYYQWQTDQTPEFFMYDFSGDQLPITGSYAYTGPKPVSPAILNKNPNKVYERSSLPEYQQTVFDKVQFTLDYIDDETDISIKPKPIELFIGYNSQNEGAQKSILQLWKKEEVVVEYNSTSTNDTYLTIQTLDPNTTDKRGIIQINTSSSETFLGKGLKEGQHIVIYVKDVTNTKSQHISSNNGVIVKIRNIFFKTLIVDFFSPEDFLYYEVTKISNYPTTGKTTYLKTTIEVIDRIIGRFFTYGQTEIEDERFKIELGNVGKLLSPNEVFIFKEYDILEGGIDWTILNKKRKEMLMMKHLIYPYIGAYKSIINAINFFGYNDLQLNEYYRNINPSSEKFLKLFKVEIPDIFDNTVEGWTESEFIKNNFPNDDYEETNMFNLTYLITDKEGNDVLNYSIDEVIIKLQGLKYWLKRNIIPLTHKILDITGKSYFNTSGEIVHTSYDIKLNNLNQNMTPVTFKLNETYLMPVNSGSTVYNCVLDFYTIVDGIGSDKNPTGLIPPPMPYNGVSLDLPDYFSISIRTYKTYKEWAPFTVYSVGDKVIYYDKLYESQKDNNKINNPRKYENVPSWQTGSSYEVTSLVEYNRDIYEFTGLGIYATSSGTMSATSSVSPNIDSKNWLNITQWKQIDYEPVQTIKEFREIPKQDSNQVRVDPIPNPVLPLNFTIDSNIDPFIIIEVTSDNGYGLTYRDIKHYEIRGIKDLRSPVKYLDKIGPFEPIKPVY